MMVNGRGGAVGIRTRLRLGVGVDRLARVYWLGSRRGVAFSISVPVGHTCGMGPGASSQPASQPIGQGLREPWGRGLLLDQQRAVIWGKI